MTEVEKS